VTETPNDAYFRQVFSDPRNAWDLLLGVLPAELLAAVDPSTLVEQETDFVDPELWLSVADLLFRAALRGAPGEECLFLLIEHQSTAPPLMALRVLAYVVRIWERWLRERRERRDLPAPTRLPLVVPVVVHQGPGRWPAARSVGDLIDVPEALLAIVAPFVPELHLLLDDLGDVSRSQVLARPGSDVVLVALAVLQAARRGDLAEALVEAAPLLQAILDRPGGSERLGEVMRYIRAAAPVEARESMKQAVEVALGPMGGAVYSIKDADIDEGRALQARRMMLHLLEARFGAIPQGIRARVEAADADALDASIAKAATAATLEEAIGDLPDEPPAGDGA
jgi:hypothetical protein